MRVLLGELDARAASGSLSAYAEIVAATALLAEKLMQQRCVVGDERGEDGEETMGMFFLSYVEAKAM